MIGNAVQRGDYTYVYNEKNQQIGSIYGKLTGYTGSTVNVRRGDYIYTYNEKLQQTGSVYAK